jgi:hypothetical protein
MDPLAVLFTRDNSPVVFMARADMFKSKVLASLLRFLKIMPVFRIRDGYENLGKNEARFNEAKEVFAGLQKPLPDAEGNHGDQHRLRPLVKGLFRIAFSAEEALKDGAHVRIVPWVLTTVIFNTQVPTWWSLTANLSSGGLLATYTENQATGMNGIKADLAEKLSPLMQDIRSEVNYDLVYWLSCLSTPAWLAVQAENKGYPRLVLRQGVASMPVGNWVCCWMRW